MKTAAIYARVSSDQQKQEKTIASQTAALVEFGRSEGYSVPAEWILQDEGYSGANLVRPGLERVRDLAAEGQIQAVLVLSPDRLSRGARCVNCARRDLCGGHRVTGVPTAMMALSSVRNRRSARTAFRPRNNAGSKIANIFGWDLGVALRAADSP